MSIPLTKSFTVSYKSQVDGKTYEGEFVTQKLTIGQRIKMGIIKNKLTDGIIYDPELNRGLDEDIEAQANAIAHCKVALTDKPDWFTAPEELRDLGLLLEVYKEVAAFEAADFQSQSATNSAEGKAQQA